MTVRVVKEEAFDEAAEKVVRPPFRFTPPVEAEAAPLERREPFDRQAATIHAVGVLTALAAVLSIRLALTLAVIAAALLTFYAETRQTPTAVVAAALFTLLGLVPVVALAYRKG
jgi:hypothetical protein